MKIRFLITAGEFQTVAENGEIKQAHFWARAGDIFLIRHIYVGENPFNGMFSVIISRTKRSYEVIIPSSIFNNPNICEIIKNKPKKIIGSK